VFAEQINARLNRIAANRLIRNAHSAILCDFDFGPSAADSSVWGIGKTDFIQYGYLLDSITTAAGCSIERITDASTIS
jgi:hypothetical protein